MTVIILILSIRVFGQDPQPPLEIRDIQPAIQGDSLVCSFASPALFSGKIKQTLFSGLPVLIELRSTLVSDSGPGGISPLMKYRLTYDIWEDQFLASATTVFASFTDLENWWNPRENLSLLPVPQVESGNTFKIDVYLRIILLTRTQGEKLKDWILNPQETEENFPAFDRDTGFKLNLNQVVSFFFSKSDVIESFEARESSARFTLDEIVGN